MEFLCPEILHLFPCLCLSSWSSSWATQAYPPLTFWEMKISSIFLWPAQEIVPSFLKSVASHSSRKHYKVLSRMCQGVDWFIWNSTQPMGQVNHVSIQMHTAHFNSLSITSWVKCERKLELSNLTSIIRDWSVLLICENLFKLRGKCIYKNIIALIHILK